MFQICTITNNPTQYAEMKDSLIQAGFTEDKCRYKVFDNAAANQHDPFRTINTVMAETMEPYVIFCHQDILLSEGHGYNQLATQLEILNKRDPEWAVAGNAGHTENLSYSARITDPSGIYYHGDLPASVCTLDENFLILRTASNIRCSLNLSGFHFYATDLCLQALQHRQGCYVIDFHLRHLSQGNIGSADFAKCLTAFKQHWNRAFTLCLIQTPCTFLFLSRSRVIHRLLNTPSVIAWNRRHIGAYTRVLRVKKRFQQGYGRLRGRRLSAAPTAQPTYHAPTSRMDG